jgi:3D (Asp-Asp-Asp) domain-containing protein
MKIIEEFEKLDYKKKIGIIVAILLGWILFLVDKYWDTPFTYIRVTEVEEVRENNSITEYYISHKVLATKYNAVEEQCDSDPLVTADLSKIDIDDLNNYKLKWVAISRDLKKYYNFGDTILVDSNNLKLNGEWVVRDVMNKRYKNRIDFLVPQNDKYDMDRPIKLEISKLIRE